MSQSTGGTAKYAGAPVALVIGCGGMGVSIARALGRRHPLVIADIDAPKLDAIIESLRLEGYTAAGHVCDITDKAQVAGLAKAIEGTGVHVLAHVAAVGMSIGDWRKMIDIDLVGAHLIADAIGPHMVAGGAAIFLSSLASYLAPYDPKIDVMVDDPMRADFLDDLRALHGAEPDFDWSYTYAKLGVNRLAEQCAIKWGPRKVRAVSLSPGMIDSPMARAEGPTLPAHDGTATRVSREDKAREIPLLREGTMLEISNVVDFLASDAASFLNGIDIPVDGGHRAAWRHRNVISR